MPAPPLPSLPPGHTGRLLRALLGFSLLFLAAHLTFQICLHTVPHLDQLLGPSCESRRAGKGVPGGSRPGGEPGEGGGASASSERSAQPQGPPCLTQALPNVGRL